MSLYSGLARMVPARLWARDVLVMVLLLVFAAGALPVALALADFVAGHRDQTEVGQ